ncbi:hypothetical protein EDB85DRAFT_2007344 [Lactarius pseudohatsudake]|nr:hypothetical protein EDB85DRAFT_2007344 [Lactarius pseudohatsudake]
MSKRGEHTAEPESPNKKICLLPKFGGTSTTPPRSRPSRPQRPDFRSDFASQGVNQRNIPSNTPRQKQRVQIQPGSVVPLESPVPSHTRPIRRIDPPRPSAAPVNDENASTAAPVGILSPPPLLPVTHSSKSTKVIEPPKILGAHPRPSTPPRSFTTPNPTSFLTPSRVPPRPSKPISSTHIARATDVLTDSGRAELLGLTLAQDGATPMENAVRRGLEVTPRKAGAGKEIRYTRGGLAERASQVIGWKTTSLSLWRKSNPSLESARMLVEIEQVLSSPKPPPQRGGLATSICLARCRPNGEERSILVLLSVPPHDAKNVPIATIKGGSRVALWEPMEEVEMGTSTVYLCSRFVIV